MLTRYKAKGKWIILCWFLRHYARVIVMKYVFMNIKHRKYNRIRNRIWCSDIYFQSFYNEIFIEIIAETLKIFLYALNSDCFYKYSKTDMQMFALSICIFAIICFLNNNTGLHLKYANWKMVWMVIYSPCWSIHLSCKSQDTTENTPFCTFYKIFSKKFIVLSTKLIYNIRW